MCVQIILIRICVAKRLSSKLHHNDAMLQHMQHLHESHHNLFFYLFCLSIIYFMTIFKGIKIFQSEES